MGFIKEIQTHRYPTWKSICTSLLFTGLRLNSAAFGPSLIDLMIQVGTTIDQITHILPTRAFGNMIGSTACGFILVYFDHQVVIIINMLIMSLSMLFIPLCSQTVVATVRCDVNRRLRCWCPGQCRQLFRHSLMG